VFLGNPYSVQQILLILSTAHYSLTLYTHILDRITALVCLYMYLPDGDFVGCEMCGMGLTL